MTDAERIEVVEMELDDVRDELSKARNALREARARCVRLDVGLESAHDSLEEADEAIRDFRRLASRYERALDMLLRVRTMLGGLRVHGRAPRQYFAHGSFTGSRWVDDLSSATPYPRDLKLRQRARALGARLLAVHVTIDPAPVEPS